MTLLWSSQPLPWLLIQQNFLMWFSPYEGRSTHCSPQQEHAKPPARPQWNRMSLLSPHLALQHKPLIFCGSLLASLHCRRVVWITNPITMRQLGSEAPPPPGAFEESVHVLSGGPLLWPAPLVSISCGDSIDTLKEEANEYAILRCAENARMEEGCHRWECLRHRY